MLTTAYCLLATGYWLLFTSQLSFEQPPQLLLRSVQLDLHRPQGQLQRLREVFIPHAVEIMRGDEQPIVRREPRDGLLEPIAQLEVGELPIGCRRRRTRAAAVVVERRFRRPRT